MAASNVNVEKLVILNRFEKGIGLLPLVFYLPLGIVLTIVRCFIFLHALLVFYFLSNISFVKNILLRVMFMVCGLVVTTDGSLHTDRHNLVLVANHMTSLDPFILNLVMRYILMVEHSWSGENFTQLCSQVTVSGQMSKDDRVQFIMKKTEESKVPLLFFPEGRRANSAYGLLKFRVLPFELGAAIQPIGIIARRWFFDISISTFNSPWWMDLLITFFVPFTVFSIKYLPLTECRDSESSEQFSERVQSNLAKGLGVAASDVTLADVKEFVKNGRQARPVATSMSRSPSSASKQTPSPSPDAQKTKPEVEVASSDPELNVMLKQVKDVLQHASSQAVLKDLEQTRDVDTTITNILEGRVDIQPKTPDAQPESLQKEVDASTFKAASFPKSAQARHLSLQERKQAMLEEARKRYKEKHGLH
ncbi:lipid droplet-regulating VLDL assembly factor AUP1-like [Babylonia areolata]|uniref:lipid droplet-regulating VLDL assembly factor AUP1-like n=1 Tax=Babylonia areolata TaxID=304850 RepID=UPI003FCF77D8